MRGWSRHVDAESMREDSGAYKKERKGLWRTDEKEELNCGEGKE